MQAGCCCAQRPDMNELQRQAYLKTMEIQVYFPRVALAGAKASPSYDVAARPALSTASSATATAKVAAIELSESTQANVAVSPATREPQRERQAVSKDALQFSLRYYKISEQLAVIDEVPHQQANASQEQAIALLQAILRALEVDSSDCEFRAESFDWPLAVELSMKNEPAVEAKHALLGFIKRRHEHDQFNNLLVFAGQIDDLLMHTSEKSETRDFAVGAAKYFITLTSSLQSMLAFPMLKRDVWQQLQPLRQRIASLKEPPSN